MDEPPLPLAPLVAAADAGDPAAARALFAALYGELHRLAQHHLARAGGQLSLSATTLLHEAYFRLADREGTAFPDRHRFLAYASRALRSVVLDHLRTRRAEKRGGSFHITGFDGVLDPPLPADQDDPRADALADALEQLGALDPALARLVDLHAFGGFTLAEVAELEQASLRTIERRWQKARLVLARLME